MPFPVLPEPALPALDGTYGIVVTGVGGTGVITIAALLGMAAHLEGKGVAALDMIGMAQKGGAVLTHLKIAPTQDEIGAPRVAAGGARLVLGCDLVVAAGAAGAPDHARGRHRRHRQPRGRHDRRLHPRPGSRLSRPSGCARRSSTRPGRRRPASSTPAGSPRALVGDAIGANLFLVGFAWQKGLIPLSREAIERAIEVNGVQVAFNRQRLPLGPPRRARSGRGRGGDRRVPPSSRQPRTLDELDRAPRRRS